jgi:PAS domain S-box-containing protein
MTGISAIAMIVLGIIYCQYGVMTIDEMILRWSVYRSERGRLASSWHFGCAWICMSFTFGPHYLAHGLAQLVFVPFSAHLLASFSLFHLTDITSPISLGMYSGDHGGLLEAIAIAVGFPPGIAWFLMRLNGTLALHGKRHGPIDFRLRRNFWVQHSITASFSAYVTTLIVIIALGPAAHHFQAIEVPNLLLMLLYTAIGWLLLRTSVLSFFSTGSWSLSAVCLAFIFPTCAITHGMFAYYVARGAYHHTVITLIIDILAVPAAIYFLLVVNAFYRKQQTDPLKLADLHADHSGTIQYASPEAEKMFGYDRGGLIGKPITVLIPHRLRSKHLVAFANAIETGEGRILNTGRAIPMDALHRSGYEFPIYLEITSRGELFRASIEKNIGERAKLT